MPQASDELRKIWEENNGDLGEQKPIWYLEDNGFRVFGGIWVYPRYRGNEPYFSDKEISALSYLRDEWDHDGFIFRKDLVINGKPAILETNKTITDWCDEKFGPIKSLKVNLARAIQEAAELLNAVALEKPVKKIAEESADIAIVLARSMEAVKSESQWEAVTIPPNYNYMNLMAESVLENLLVIYKHSETGYMTIHDVQNFLVSVLERICICCQSNLYDEICDKMFINRKRKWATTGQGTGYHV